MNRKTHGDKTAFPMSDGKSHSKAQRSDNCLDDILEPDQPSHTCSELK